MRATFRMAGAAALFGLALGLGGMVNAAPPSAADARPDLAGYWVALVTEDWRFRMVTPGPGEYAGIPINAAAEQAADAWDPARDEAAGEQCRSYGAGGLMRMPGRLHISWADEHTLKVEMDNGMQTRLLHIDSPAGAGVNHAPDWQGYSSATWEGGALKTVTTRLRPGYIRRNGVPYGTRAALTEYWDSYREADGAELLVITSLLEDPDFLQAPYGFSPIFRREPDGKRWAPTPCKAQ